MHTLFAVLAIYLVYVLLVGSLISITVQRDRGALTVVAALMPFMIVMSFIRAIVDVILGTARSPEPITARFEAAEKLVEERRSEVFDVPESQVWVSRLLQERYRLHLSEQAEYVGNVMGHHGIAA